MGRIEFRDIKYYTTVSSTGKYEDNPNFCRERYEDAKLTCEVLFEAFYDKDPFNGIAILFPTERHVKLNNLRGFAKDMGEDVSFFTTEEWKEISTMEKY